MEDKTINQLLDIIQYSVEDEPDNERLVREGLLIIINKLKDAKKLK